MSLTVDIGKFRNRFGGKMSTFKRGVMIKLFGAVIKDTPVLTGRLRANWQFSKGQPVSETIEGTTDPTAAVSQDVAAQVDEKDDRYFLSNNMPYARRIEYEGWSKRKAPQGMVRKNMIRIAANLQKEAAKLP